MTTTAHKIEAEDLNEHLNCRAKDILTSLGCSPKEPYSNGEIRGFCPFCQANNNKLYSKNDTDFSYNINDFTFCCHRSNCSIGGGRGMIDVIMKSKNLSGDFPEILEKIANDYGFIPNMETMKISSTVPLEQILSNKINPPKNKLSAAEVKKTIDKIWKEGSSEGKNPYFEKKKVIPPAGIKYGKFKSSNNNIFDVILVPYYDVEGNLLYVQRVSNYGKFWIEGCPSSGGFFPIGDLGTATEIYICEGLATAATIWETLGGETPVISVGSASNLSNIANAIHVKYSRLKIIIALDIGADKEIEKIKDKIYFTSPCFDNMEWEGNGVEPKEGEKKPKKPTDFNDLVSRCDQSLTTVKDQLKKEYTPDNSIREQLIDNEQMKEVEMTTSQMETEKSPPKTSYDFRLAVAIGCPELVASLEDRNYEMFEAEHKKLLSEGALMTGIQSIDEKVVFSKGDLITIQGLSNHGKSTFMLTLAHKFVTYLDNSKADPLCVFITYESSRVRVEEKLINLISHECNEGTAIKYDSRSTNRYLYGGKEDFKKTIDQFDHLQRERKITVLPRVQLEKLNDLIDMLKAENPDRTIVLFLDYLQIIDTDIKSDGWEKIKVISYALEKLAIKKEVIIFNASQVNENRQSREGRDIFNASTTVIDVFNHSHISLKTHKDLAPKYRAKVDGSSVITLSVLKQKHGETYECEEDFLFNGYMFYEKLTQQTSMRENFDDLM